MGKEKQVKEKKTKKKSNTPKELSPFDIIKMMFSSMDSFEKLSDLMLERHSFLINRIFAIQYPEHAQLFNRIGMKGCNTLRAWRVFAVRKHGMNRVPFFVYTKAEKKITAGNKKNKPEYTKEEISHYCNHFNISLKDFTDMQYFFPDELKDKMDILTSLTTKEGLKQQFSVEKIKKRKQTNENL